MFKSIKTFICFPDTKFSSVKLVFCELLFFMIFMFFCAFPSSWNEQADCQDIARVSMHTILPRLHDTATLLSKHINSLVFPKARNNRPGRTFFRPCPSKWQTYLLDLICASILNNLANIYVIPT